MARRHKELPLPDFSPGFLERFVDIQEIGSGGMARVFRARQLPMNRPVAIKLIHPLAVRDTATLQRFVQEARITAALQHPNIVKILDTGEESELPYLVFELVEGGRTLDDRIRQEGHLSLKDALGVVSDLADALAHAHEHGIIHRDLKPENVLITREGTPKIADFGLAKLEDSSRRLTGIGFSVGTPGYMSPEQVLGNETDARSDVYALGVMLYEMLTGALPYPSHNDMNVMLDRMQHAYPAIRSKRPDVPQAVEDLVAGALQLELADRIPSARDFREAALDILKPDRSGRVVRSRPVRSVPSKQLKPVTAAGAKPRAKWRPSASMVGLAVAAVLVFLASAAFTTMRSGARGAAAAFEATGVVAMPGIASARIYWTSGAPYKATVRIWEAGKGEERGREQTEPVARTHHDLIVQSLEPGLPYQYRILFPDGGQSLLYNVRIPDATALEARNLTLSPAPGGGALFTWETNAPARCTLVLSDGRNIPEGRTYRRRHRVVVPDYPLLDARLEPSVRCVALGGTANAPFPVQSAAEAASELEKEATRLDVKDLVRRFDQQVRRRHESAVGLLPKPLADAAARFAPLAQAWFAEGLVARRLALYHLTAKLESVDALWAAVDLELPLKAAALSQPFVATDYPPEMPAGSKPLAGGAIDGAHLRAANAPSSMNKITTLASAESVTTTRAVHKLSKAELDAADRVWLSLNISTISAEEHVRVRVNGVLDVTFRPAAVGWPGMRGASGPPPYKASVISRGLPAELLRPGDNEFELTFDSVPGVASLGTVKVRAATIQLSR